MGEAFHIFNPEGSSNKDKLRKQMLAERLSFPIEEKNTADWQLMNNLRRVLMLESEVGVVALYVAIKGEPDILGSEIINLRNSGIVVTLPRVIEKDWPLTFNTYNPSYDFSYDALGLECAGGPVAMPRIVCIPCLAFNREGHRLGYGGGYYDRTIEDLKKKERVITIGVAYSSQEVKDLPLEEHDQQLDFIVTEKEVITCQG
jgi:5-formyltetrahydrofolate cyclo-ligase